MKVLLVLLALLAVSPCQQSNESIPDKVKTAKTVILAVYWPEADPRDKMEVQHEGEQFIQKWGRFQIVQDIAKADIAAVIVVRPTEVMPGFWQRLSAAYAAQGRTYCNTNAQNYGGGMVQAQTTCYTYQGNQAAAQAAMLPSTVLGGSILVFDSVDVQKDMAAGFTLFTGNAKPLLASFAEAKGYAPLRGAAKRLKKLIDSGEKKKRS